jgi:AraC-like DNA-binding protein
VQVTTTRVDGVFGSWTQTEARSVRLAGLVDRIWHFQGKTSVARERSFPNGQLEIIVHLGEPFREIRGSSAERYPLACINGLQTNTFLIEAPATPCAVLGIRLSPAGAYALLGTPLIDISDITVDLTDVAGRSTEELVDACSAVSSGEDRVRAAMRWVCARMARGMRMDPAVAWSIGEIERVNGSVSIAAVRERIGFTKGRLVDAFREQVGLPPKAFARVIRFRHVLRQLHAGAESLAEVAVAAGLYDQPHLNAEFKALSGFTPTEFLAAQRYSATSLAEATR